MKNLITLFLFCFFSFSLIANENAFNAESKKIALLFLTRSDLNHPQLWKEWIDTDYYTLYSHTKYPAKDPWFAQFWIKERVPNEWGYTLWAQQILLRVALKDSSNYKFVFLSESCIPLKTNQEVYQILTGDERSHMRWCPPWWAKSNSFRTLNEFPVEHHLGNHQWIILNRKHAEMIANDDYWLDLAMKHLCCDEAYPSTFFSMHGVLDEFRNEMTTHVDWKRGGPYIFKEASEENIQLLLNARANMHGVGDPTCHLFARKIAPGFPDYVLKWIQKGVNPGSK